MEAILFHTLMNTVTTHLSEKETLDLGLPLEWQGKHEYASMQIETNNQWTDTLHLFLDLVEARGLHELDRYVSPLFSVNLDL